jgi:ketosteroid isomerase-like protein
MKRLLIVAYFSLFMALGVGSDPTAAQGNDPVSVWKRFEAALNAADANAVAELFADDGAFVDTHPVDGLSGVWRGKGQIRELFKGVLHPGDHQESGSFLVGAFGHNGQLTVDDVRQWFGPGVDLPPGMPVPLESRFHMTVRDGKIMVMTIDNKPEWLVSAGVEGKDPGNETPEPLAVWQAFLAAANKPDAAAVTALFAEDGAFVDTHPSPGLSGIWQGHAALLELFKPSFNPGDRWESSGYLVGAFGNKHQMTIQSVRDWLAPGPNLPEGVPLPVESRFHMTVQDGKIKLLVNDNTPDWLARAGGLGQPVVQAEGMPRTGGAGSTSDVYLWLVLLGGLAFAGGVIVRQVRQPI